MSRTSTMKDLHKEIWRLRQKRKDYLDLIYQLEKVLRFLDDLPEGIEVTVKVTGLHPDMTEPAPVATEVDQAPTELVQDYGERSESTEAQDDEDDDGTEPSSPLVVEDDTDPSLLNTPARRREAVRQVLKEHGPSTPAEIAIRIGSAGYQFVGSTSPRGQVSNTLNNSEEFRRTDDNLWAWVPKDPEDGHRNFKTALKHEGEDC